MGGTSQEMVMNTVLKITLRRLSMPNSLQNSQSTDKTSLFESELRSVTINAKRILRSHDKPSRFTRFVFCFRFMSISLYSYLQISRQTKQISLNGLNCTYVRSCCCSDVHIAGDKQPSNSPDRLAHGTTLQTFLMLAPTILRWEIY